MLCLKRKQAIQIYVIPSVNREIGGGSAIGLDWKTNN